MLFEASSSISVNAEEGGTASLHGKEILGIVTLKPLQCRKALYQFAASCRKHREASRHAVPSG